MLLIWHPGCSTCKRARQWLDSHGISYELRDIRQDNPTREELALWQKKNGWPLKKFFNTSGQQYRALGLRDRLASMGKEEQLDILASDGMLVRRPVLVWENGVLLGFREAEWQEALEGHTEG